MLSNTSTPESTAPWAAFWALITEAEAHQPGDELGEQI